MKNKKFFVKKIDISNYQSGQRIDNFLFNRLKNIPKNTIYRMLRKGIIKINGKKNKPFYKLKNKDEIFLPSLQVKKSFNQYSLNKIKYLINTIIYEDECILIINKPSGSAVHGGSGIYCGIIEGLRILRPELKFLELVHRLDRETSGILIMAKSLSVLRFLNIQLFEKKMKKKYFALVHGIWPEKITRIKISLIKKNNKIIVANSLGKLSETIFKIKKKYNNFTFMEIIPITGRTHQIRVHACYIGNPIIFDTKYGNIKLDTKTKFVNNLNRLFLHAYSLTFMHPNTKKIIKIKIPIDKKLNDCLLELSKNKKL